MTASTSTPSGELRNAITSGSVQPVAAQAADHIGTGHLVEHRADDLDLAQRALLAEALAACARRPSSRARRCARSRARACGNDSRKALPRTAGRGNRGWRSARSRPRHPRRAAGRDRARRTRSPGSTPTVSKSLRVIGAEEGLQELGVGQRLDAGRVLGLDRSPERVSCAEPARRRLISATVAFTDVA